MRVLHVLNGLHAAGIEALALQLIAHSPAAVQAAQARIKPHLPPGWRPGLCASGEPPA